MKITKGKIKQSNGTMSEWIPLGTTGENIDITITSYQSELVEEGNSTTMTLQQAIDAGILIGKKCEWNIVAMAESEPVGE